ncbi:MAG: ABC transporter ATP-binding protein [Bacteroidia bacterium]
MIRISNIHKSYGKKGVLIDVNAEISEKKITAILGPNGAGKTTLIKSILGHVIPEKGKILISGKNIINSWEYKSKIGYMPQIANLPENLTPNELIKMIQDIRGVDGHRCKYVSMFDYEEMMDKPFRTLSGGTKQKVSATIAFMFDAPILIFDEPTVGLDPIARLKLKDVIKQEKTKGKTILLTTHIMSEVEELADEIMFILDGKIYFHGQVEILKALYDEDDLERAIAKILEGNNSIQKAAIRKIKQ